MHAVIVRSTLHDFEKGRAFLRSDVVPRVSQAPGLVGAYWVRVAEDQGTATIVFESEEAARAMADQVQAPPDGSVSLDSVQVGEVVESA
jgi:hypothetical protein